MPVCLRPSKLSKRDKKRHPNARNAAILIVYSETDFNRFYNKHCGRINTESEYTLITIGEFECPSIDVMRAFFEAVIIHPKVQLFEDPAFAELPRPFKVRIYDGKQDEFLDTSPGKGNLRMRDCKRLELKDYEYLLKTEELSQEDINTIRIFKEKAAQTNSFIKFVWFIRHIDVVKIR